MYKIQVYKRRDKKWAWRVLSANGNIVAVDGNQGFEKSADAMASVTNLIYKSKVSKTEIIPERPSFFSKFKK